MERLKDEGCKYMKKCLAYDEKKNIG